MIKRGDWNRVPQSCRTLSPCGIAWSVTILWLGVVGWMGTASIAVPETARAQNNASASVPEAQVALFAKVVLELEPHRQELLEQANRATDETAKLDIKREFIRKATEIIETNEMTVPDYNRITIQLKQDDALKERIESEILRLQTQASPKP
ncbi:MAG: DUF4168 domain-containing protein [Cyanobacteria bacterium P01_F01_bin.33]